jgi:hypothetical protein
MNRVPNDAEPGTGTQLHVYANEPCRCQSPPYPPDEAECPQQDSRKHGKPATFKANGTKWKCGRDYLDTELADVAYLEAVVGKSSWCDTRDPEDCPPKLVFRYERRDGTVTVDPNDPSGEVQERFIERYQKPVRMP